LTWEQWELIAELFPKEKPGGRPRTVAMYAIVNAILYVLCSGRGEPYQEIFLLGQLFRVISGEGAKMVRG
jgi:hypothetical protein